MGSTKEGKRKKISWSRSSLRMTGKGKKSLGGGTGIEHTEINKNR